MAMSFGSCKKDSGTESFKSELVGTWEIREHICGECLHFHTYYEPGNGNYIYFGSDGRFRMSVKDSITNEGKYRLVIRDDCGGAAGDGRILLFEENESSSQSGFEAFVKADSLFLSARTCYTDYFITSYKRIK